MADIDMTGMKAPSFCLKDQEGKEVCSKDLHGSWTVLYFYPKDNTSGCTIEAKDFTCMVTDFKNEEARIIGVSPDSERSHQNFTGTHELELTLLSDLEKEALQGFGAWKVKKRYGREFMGVERSTFLIDPDGVIRKEWRKVKVKGHAAEVLVSLKNLK